MHPPLPVPPLIEWFRSQARIFPWSQTRDPYAIWISEIMLQQTVVTAAVDHFVRWMARWPNLPALAQAGEEEVLRQWEGLGYYSRGRNLLKAARLLASQGQTVLPADYDSLRRLPGLGDYTASAILSFAWDKPYLTLDANLKRVFQRFWAAAEWDKTLEARARDWAQTAFAGASSREVNLGLMQLGQQICQARTPQCRHCPLADGCQAFRLNLTAAIPAPKLRTSQEVFTSPLVQVYAGQVRLARPASGRFSDLWLFPPLEALPRDLTPLALAPRLHTYTKFKDRLTPVLVDSPVPLPLKAGWIERWVGFDQAETLAMPAVYRKIWQEALKILKSTGNSGQTL